jgi:hypothetical protein
MLGFRALPKGRGSVMPAILKKAAVDATEAGRNPGSTAFGGAVSREGVRRHPT